MFFSVIINNYNYANFICDAIESVLKQSHKNFEIIIVDDKSTDNSIEVLQKYAHYENIQLLFLEKNLGQANALNVGVANAKGDAICFLDADDFFHTEKLMILKPLFESGIHYVHHKHTTIQNNEEIANLLKYFPYSGHSSFLIYYLSHYVGNICSTLSISATLAKSIFPLPFTQEWRIQADDLIVFSAALHTKAVFVDTKLTNYRIHNNNGYFGKKISSSDKYQLLKKRNKAKEKICKSLNIVDIFFTNSYNLKSELETYNHIDWFLVKLYLKVVWYEMHLPLLNKIQTSIFILKKLKEKNAP